jgi:L-lysine 2,3-aminomutase
VQGAAHFEVDDARARALHAELSARLSGYLVPRLVREVAGDPGKRPL